MFSLFGTIGQESQSYRRSTPKKRDGKKTKAFGKTAPKASGGGQDKTRNCKEVCCDDMFAHDIDFHRCA